MRLPESAVSPTPVPALHFAASRKRSQPQRRIRTSSLPHKSLEKESQADDTIFRDAQQECRPTQFLATSAETVVTINYHQKLKTETRLYQLAVKSPRQESLFKYPND